MVHVVSYKLLISVTLMLEIGDIKVQDFYQIGKIITRVFSIYLYKYVNLGSRNDKLPLKPTENTKKFYRSIFNIYLKKVESGISFII